MNEQEKAALRKLAEENSLTKDDFFSQVLKNKDGTTSKLVIVKRSGIEKLLFNNHFRVDYHAELLGIDHAIIKSVIYDKDGKEVIQTYGSAHKGNVKGGMNYFVEMAEKRALSRGVLKAIRAYKYNVFGEDEIID